MFGLKTIPPALQHAVRDLLFFVSIFMNRACIFMILLLHLNVPPFMVCGSGPQQSGHSSKGPKSRGKGKGKKSDDDDDNNDEGSDQSSDRGRARRSGSKRSDDAENNEGGDSNEDPDRDNEDPDRDDENPHSDDEDGEDNEGNEREKKTFDFYFQKNRARTGAARQSIKQILVAIKEIEARQPAQNVGIANGRATKLGQLNTQLEAVCNRYKIQTKYYQAGNFNTMPLSWWTKSSKKERWHHDGGYYYNSEKHGQFVVAVQAAQMFDDTNDDFFDTYEVECAKWYASWARYGADKEPNTPNTWGHDSYNTLPDTKNEEDLSMVLVRLASDVFPALGDNAMQKPRPKKSKLEYGGGSPAGSASKKQRVPKDAAGAGDADAAAEAAGAKKKQKSGWCKKQERKARLAANALADNENDHSNDDDDGDEVPVEADKVPAEADKVPAEADKVQAEAAEAAKVQAKKTAKDTDLFAQRLALQAGVGGRGGGRGSGGVGGSSSRQVPLADQRIVPSGPSTMQLNESQVRMAAGANEIGKKEIDLVDLTAETDSDSEVASGSAPQQSAPKKFRVKYEGDEVQDGSP